MAPGVCLTTLATPELCGAPVPVGQFTAVPVPTWLLPGRADVGEVVGEVVRRPGAVGAVDDGDVLAGQVFARVELLDRRVVPVRDLAEVDLGEHRAAHTQKVAAGRVVVEDRGRCERPRDLQASLARSELIRCQRSVARAEVDGTPGDRRDAGTGTNRAVVEGYPERRIDRSDPGLHERRDERAAGAVQGRAAALGGRRSGHDDSQSCDEACGSESKGDANELAVSRHLIFPPPQGFAGKVRPVLRRVG